MSMHDCEVAHLVILVGMLSCKLSIKHRSHHSNGDSDETDVKREPFIAQQGGLDCVRVLKKQ